MRKILALAALVAAAIVPAAHSAAGTTKTYSLLLHGGDGPNVISIDFAENRTKYLIKANGALPVPTDKETHQPVTYCSNPPGEPDELLCDSSAITGIVAQPGDGNDTITVGKTVPVPTIIEGGHGIDDLIGGAGTDRIVGGEGADKLVGRRGPDQLFGGKGEDLLIGGAGKDVLRGGPDADVLRGGPGRDDIRQ
jgi:Ca2+-binding RTX toxin-like protein